MTRHTEFIKLSKEERRSLKTLFAGGSGSNRKHNRARILDLLSKQTPLPEIARLLDCSLMTVYHIKRRFLSEGLESALSEKPRSGKPVSISGEARARITALACSDAPEGHARWTLRLLADKAVELGFVESVSHNHVRQILKKTRSDRT
ncbi:Mobile element protein [uncultured Microcoleus sp.]|uniref:Mobile element protein n=1 Tax=uncultured Microcoleus sp. TaxID=259945 RepID=A0A6J4NAD5_9CYAN|nr:Mobile element protein [uncultured Microcoleus sp.]